MSIIDETSAVASRAVPLPDTACRWCGRHGQLLRQCCDDPTHGVMVCADRPSCRQAIGAYDEQLCLNHLVRDCERCRPPLGHHEESLLVLLRDEFPDWVIGRGIEGLWSAHPAEGPQFAVLADAADGPDGLADQLHDDEYIEACARHALPLTAAGDMAGCR